jgi:predicted regulator of amino acid metabolism with ACT domain
MTSINKRVWDYIDRSTEIKKVMQAGLINTSALAREIARKEGLASNIDAIISAIRRYENESEKTKQYKTFYELLKKSKIKTKLASILIKRNDYTQEQVGKLYSRIKLKRNSTLKILEVTNHIKINMDDELLEEIKSAFPEEDIEYVQKNLGELLINYSDDITKIPGVFAALANELAMNGISVIDSMICHWEHSVMVKEEDLEKAFSVVFNLTKSG